MTDIDNCGACGVACVGGSCRNGRCVPLPDSAQTVCRAERLRIWLNAFVPEEGPHAPHSVSIDGQPQSIFSVPGSVATPPSGQPLLFLTDRPLQDPHLLPEPGSFSIDPNAPSQAQLVFEIFLPEMRLDHVTTLGGRLIQVAERQGQVSLLCERSLGEPFLPGGGFWQQSSLSPDGARLTIALDAAWRLGNEDVAGPSCVDVDLSLIRVKGSLIITKRDISVFDPASAGFDASVRVQFVDSEIPDQQGFVTPFPAFELYAALDDGNRQPVFRQSPANAWVDPAAPELVMVSDAANLRLRCGCKGCEPGRSCTALSSTSPETSCSELDGSFVLASAAAAADPACLASGTALAGCASARLNVGDDLEVVRKVTVAASAGGHPTIVTQPVYRYDTRGTRAIPPIGMQAKTGDVIEINARHSIGFERGIAPFVLYRIDGAHFPPREVFRSNGFPFESASDDTAPFFTASFANQTEPLHDRGTICCSDGQAFPCVDHRSDPDNCGGCGINCANDEICSGGECRCPAPLTSFNGFCVDPIRTDHACGPLFENCTAHEPPMICVRSTCVTKNCDPGMHACGDRCMNDDSAASCGARCEPCPEPGVASSHTTCENFNCSWRCDAGFHLCPGDICLSDDDVGSCGDRCEPCPFPRNGNVACVDQLCRFAGCNEGFQQCGEECFSFFDESHCLDCNTQCTPGVDRCTVAGCCPNSSTICDFQCVNLSFSHEHCGECFHDCGDLTCCGGCTDTRSDFGNCGGCGNACQLGEECIESVCMRIPDPPPPDCPPGSIPDGAGGCKPEFLGPEG
jgi:hypothetical protein